MPVIGIPGRGISRSNACVPSSTAPADVAEMVVEAIHQRRLYVLTHPELAFAAIKARLEWMETGEPAENRPF